MNQTKIKAEIVGHSLSPQGDELISVLCTFPRIILAEVNTHRMLSKNTSSSRAIPFNKMVEAVQNNPFIPIAWQKEHKGMQGNEYITDELEIEFATSNWLAAKKDAIKWAEALNGNNSYPSVTKQLCNRLLEPFMWTTMLITGSKEGWDNFFNLRCPQYKLGDEIFKSKKDWKNRLEKDLNNKTDDKTPLFWLRINKGQAEIHMMALAECIYDAVNESTPEQLNPGQWHVPFIDKIIHNNITLSNEELVKITTAMAAHTSYTIVGGEAVKSYEKWIELYDKLIAYDPPHSSPMEHCARAMSNYEYQSFVKGYTLPIDDETNYRNTLSEGWCNNLKGFIPLRYFMDNSIK